MRAHDEASGDGTSGVGRTAGGTSEREARVAGLSSDGGAQAALLEMKDKMRTLSLENSEHFLSPLSNF